MPFLLSLPLGGRGTKSCNFLLSQVALSVAFLLTRQLDLELFRVCLSIIESQDWFNPSFNKYQE